MDESEPPSQLCLSHHPPLHPNQAIHCLSIVDQIACGDTRGSQVVTCPINKHCLVRVAMSFDPLYYHFDGGFNPKYCEDWPGSTYKRVAGKGASIVVQ